MKAKDPLWHDANERLTDIAVNHAAADTLRYAYAWLDRCGTKAAGEYLRQHRDSCKNRPPREQVSAD